MVKIRVIFNDEIVDPCYLHLSIDAYEWQQLIGDILADGYADHCSQYANISKEPNKSKRNEWRQQTTCTNWKRKRVAMVKV